MADLRKMLNYKEAYDRLSVHLDHDQKAELKQLLESHEKLEQAFEEACLSLEKLTYAQNLELKDKNYKP